MNAHGRPFLRIVLAIVKRQCSRPFNNVACLHVSPTGDVVGCSMQPERYLSDHNDLIGKAIDMPSFSVEFFNTPPDTPPAEETE